MQRNSSPRKSFQFPGSLYQSGARMRTLRIQAKIWKWKPLPEINLAYKINVNVERVGLFER